MTLSSRFSYLVAAMAPSARDRWCPVHVDRQLLEEASQRAGGGFLRGPVGTAPQRRQPLVARHHPRERRQDRVHARVVAPLVCVDAQIRQHRHFEVLVDGMYSRLEDH